MRKQEVDYDRIHSDFKFVITFYGISLACIIFLFVPCIVGYITISKWIF